MDSLRGVKLTTSQLKRVVEMFAEEVYRDLSVSMECSEEELMEMWADVYDKKCEFKVVVEKKDKVVTRDCEKRGSHYISEMGKRCCSHHYKKFV